MVLLPWTTTRHRSHSLEITACFEKKEGIGMQQKYLQPLEYSLEISLPYFLKWGSVKEESGKKSQKNAEGEKSLSPVTKCSY